MRPIWSDLGYGARSLRKSAGFTVISIVTLALGIGADSAIFSMMDSEMLRPLPYQNPARLVTVSEGTDDPSVPPADFLGWQTQARSFDGIAAITPPEQAILTGADTPDQMVVARASDNFFRVLGRAAVIGDAFLPKDQQGVVLSHRYWHQEFGANPAVIGKVININGQPFTIVGVMPRDFHFEQSDLWELLTLSAARQAKGQDPLLRVVARLKPRVTFEQANAEMRLLVMRQHPRVHGTDARQAVNIAPVARPEFNQRSYLFALLGAVTFILLIACSSVTSMFAARATARQREFAVRAALGAGRKRLVAQPMAESMIVAALGGILGLALADGILQTIKSLAPNDPFATNITGGSLNLHVVLFMFGLSVITGVLIGFIPLRSVRGFALMPALHDGSSGSGAGASKSRVQAMVVVLEIALSLTLLIGAGLMIESLRYLGRVRTGLNASGVLTVRMPLIAYRYGRAPQTVAYYMDILDRIRSIPGVQYAAVTNNFPLSDASVNLSIYPPRTSEEKVVVDLKDVTPGYFGAMGIPLLRGRFFTDADSSQSQPVAIVNEAMARRYWSGRDPIGETIVGKWTVVGIAGDTVQSSLGILPAPALYRPYAQQPFASNIATLIIRSYGDPALLASAIRSAVWSLEPDQPLLQVRTMKEVLADSIWEPRLSASMFALLAFLAMFISMVGLYGVISCSVSQRTREMGLRLALGGNPRDVLKLMVGEALLLAILGAFLGTTAALGLTRFLKSILFGISPLDPSTFCGCVGLILAVAVVAAYVPASRAMSVDPVTALRHE